MLEMKPDGVTTAPSEPMEAEGTEPVEEPAGNEGASQNGSSPSPPQPDEPQNEQKSPPAVKEAPGKAVDPKSKSKGLVKGKTTTAGPATTGPGARPKATQSRVANGLAKTAASTATKKTLLATTVAAEKKRPTGAAAPGKKPVGSAAAVANARTQPKVTAVGASRSTTVTSSTKTGTTAGTASTLSKRPTTAATAKKPKTTALAPRPTTAPRVATAPAAKPSTSSTAKTTSAPKTRTTGSSAPRPAATSAAAKTVTNTSSAVAKTIRTATQQSVKPSVTASAARKDVSKTGTTAPAKKPAGSTMSRLAASKPSNSEASKPAAATKRPPPSIKAPQPKPDYKKIVPTRKVPPSPRNTSSRPTSGKTIAASPSHRQADSSATTKPTQSVLPLVKGKSDDKEPVAESVQLSAAVVATVAVATAAAIVTEESVSVNEATPAVEGSLDAPASDSLDVQENVDVQVLNANSQSVLDIPNTEPMAQEALIEAGPFEKSGHISSAVNLVSEEQCSRKVDEMLIAAVEPVAQEAVQQETITASPTDNPAAAIVPCGGIEVAEKAELINNGCYEDVEEEEREGSQQVSLSEMSGTQPTEESRPGSAGLAGSVWRAGALLSELDSEDVSCSQQGASELSAPGVLEGTESMDDLGDASLKGADGEGASVGSPDFEKLPDIPPNEDDEDDDDDDDDRVCDMEVGSERAEDSNRQHHDNEDDEEDEDVEMASEGITESGLESYGNADEDDLTEDYRLDNLNRIQPSPTVVSAPLAAQWNQSKCFADPWAQPPQPASTLLSSPSFEPLQADPETPIQAPAQAKLDVSNSEKSPSSSNPPNLFELPPCSPHRTLVTAAEGDVSPKPGTSPQAGNSQYGTLSGPDLPSDSSRDTIIPEIVKECNNCSGIEIQSKEEFLPEPLNPAPTVLPDIMQDLGIHLECADEEEEPETLPADDVLGDPATAPESAPSSPSSATEDEASDTEGEMQISDPQAELLATGSTNGTKTVAHSLSTLEEREEIGGETEGGGGSDTPQSATSAASYGFDYMTSNSNALSSAESCSKSPGIFSLENEEQLPDEAKDPSLLKELTLIPTTVTSGEKNEPLRSQHVGFQSHSEQQYMLCGESSELPESDSLPGAVPLESGSIDHLPPQHLEEEQDVDSQHPYYSTVSENTDSPLAGRNSQFSQHPQDLLSVQMTMSSKIRLRPRAAHVSQPPRLPTDLPPRIPSTGSNMQLRCLEQHQKQLHEIQQRHEKQNREQECQEAVREEKEVRNEKEDEKLETQTRTLFELQLKQQEQELKQQQQIMQWQQELEQQQQKQKIPPVLLSPSSGLCTIYESVEISDTEDEEENEQVLEETKKAEDKNTFEVFPNEDEPRCTKENNEDYLYSQFTTPSLEPTQDLQREYGEKDTAADQTSPPQSPPRSSEIPPPLEFDWGKKVDIVQQLINQTLLLTGDGCSPLLLLPGGAGGTLSPLECSLWPNLLPPLTPPSATVTSVSSFSSEAPGSSAQGEWTVVELETHH
ncbi:uncharacterized protein LOC127444870 [Myxocyprinus asiaticus]|uniref:uncharacterized protein LOC127444870 n=1 Tax=Myxocyprinus asiaticus TaxID=70543 RepID=UPI002222CDDE|nr:uncharacterized protein LOC127444870 [Myxocyprinus asiaticus]